jgi:hypothetical protein
MGFDLSPDPLTDEEKAKADAERNAAWWKRFQQGGVYYLPKDSTQTVALAALLGVRVLMGQSVPPDAQTTESVMDRALTYIEAYYYRRETECFCGQSNCHRHMIFSFLKYAATRPLDEVTAPEAPATQES